MLRPAAALLTLVAPLSLAHAFDVGAPIFYIDPYSCGVANRFEVYYESYDRTAMLDGLRLDVGPIGGTPVVSFTGLPFEDDIEASFIAGRWVRHLAPNVTAQCEIGVSGLGDSADTSVLIGGAVKWLVGSTGLVNYTLQVNANYLPERGDDYSGVDSAGDAFVGYEEFDLFEFGGSLLASMMIAQNGYSQSTVYTGPRASAARGDYTAVIDYPGLGARGTVTADIEESQVFGWVVGVHANYNQRCNVRVEARVIDEASLTVGSSIIF